MFCYGNIHTPHPECFSFENPPTLLKFSLSLILSFKNVGVQDRPLISSQIKFTIIYLHTEHDALELCKEYLKYSTNDEAVKRRKVS